MKHSGRTIKEAPALEASRTLERARVRLVGLSAPVDGGGGEGLAFWRGQELGNSRVGRDEMREGELRI